MIWAYIAPGTRGETEIRYGTPVTVHVPGKGLMPAVYQFGTPTQVCAVVHLQSGQIIAHIEEHHRGYPQERARAACKERFDAMPRTFASDAQIVRTIDSAPVLNTVPSVVGAMRRWPPCT